MAQLTRRNAVLPVTALTLFFSFLLLAYSPAPSSAQAEIPIEALRVLSVRETGLIAGTMGMAAVLSPDGTRFAYVSTERLCIYSIDVVVQSCANLLVHDELRSLNLESIAWSPLGTWLTFTSDAFRFFRDSDIWVMNADTAALANLTNDRTLTGLLQPDADGFLDISPRWLPDGRILFLRYAFRSGDPNFGPPELYAIEPTGRGLERLGQLPHDSQSITAIFPALDGARIAYFHVSGENPNDEGLWLSDLDGNNASPAWNLDSLSDNRNPANHPANLMSTAAFSPDERYLLSIGFHPPTLNVPEESVVRVTPLADVPATPQLVDDENGAVIGAGWLPSGAGLIYLVRNPSDPDREGLYVTAETGARGRQVLQGRYGPPTPYWQMPLLWGETNTILLTDRSNFNFGLVIVTLGQ